MKLLSQQTPASIVFFDLLCEGERDLCGQPFEERRKQLESLLGSAVPPVHITPATYETNVASDWFRRFEGAGLDGVIAKPREGTYEPDKRVMLKVKHERDCDCVVAGFRWHKTGEGIVGSLLLGLFDDAGGCSTSVSAPASRWRSEGNWRNSFCLIETTRSPIIRGAAGRSRARAGNACPEARAAGARAKTCPGSPCGQSW